MSEQQTRNLIERNSLIGGPVTINVPQGASILPNRKRGTRYYIDTEFVDDGTTIDLISIGIVCEDGRELYLQSVEFDPVKASGWVRENVLSHLKVCHVSGKWNLDKSLYSWERCEKPDCAWRTREQIRDEIISFLGTESFDLFSWCSGYDFVAFCQLFGTMMDLPAFYPHYINDLQQELDKRGITDDELPPQEQGLHNALHDARHIRHLWGVTQGHYAPDPILPPYVG